MPRRMISRISSRSSGVTLVTQQASGSRWLVPFLGYLLVDPYDVVRYRAHRSLQTIDGFEGFEYDYISSAKERQSARKRLSDLWKDMEKRENLPRGRNILINDPPVRDTRPPVRDIRVGRVFP